MFELKITEIVFIKIDNFLSSYLNASLSLFDDSWIDNVYIIRQNYIKTVSNFRDDIFSSLHKILTEEDIIYKRIKNGISTVISLRNWNLFVYYTEDKKQKIRFIEDIEFNRR